MAEILSRSATEYAAGRKVLADTQNRVTAVVIEMPAAWTAGASDTVATGIVIPKFARLLAPVTVSNSAGTASQTVSVGLRNNLTKVAVDATGIVNAAAITAAACAQFNTGTMLINGQRTPLAVDCEVYLTFSAHVPTANQSIRVEFEYMTP